MPRQRRGIRGDVGIAPYNRLPYPCLVLTLSFRASDRRHWRGNPSPAPAGAASPRPPLCEAAQCSHWVVRRSVAEVSEPKVLTEGEAGGVEPRPYTRSDVPCERPLPLPLGEVAERSEDGEGKP